MMRPNSETTSFYLPRFSLACAAVLAAALIGSGSPARAGFTTYFGIDQGDGTPPTTPVNSLAARNLFLSALGTSGVENFDSFAVNSTPPTLSFTGSGVTASASYSSDEFINNVQDNGEFATSGTKYLDAQGTRDDKLVLSAPVAGVGFYITDLSDGFNPADQISIVATLVGGGTETVTTNVGTSNTSANVLFFGVVSSGSSALISQVEILNTQPTAGDYNGLDDLTIGLRPVPEPASVGMVALGLGAVLAARRLRRRSGSPPCK
jgi:PEP-CTERM motif